MDNRIVFITGGARSGKSSFALAEASKIKGRGAFIATAEAVDEEMIKRIEHHKRGRGPGWTTFEEPLQIAGLIEKIQDLHPVIIVDCLTVWLANVMMAGLDAQKETERLADTIVKGAPSPIYIVSNEVGMGIVPENGLAREFRDMAGFLNQRIASIAHAVYITVAGIPLRIKGGS